MQYVNYMASHIADNLELFHKKGRILFAIHLAYRGRENSCCMIVKFYVIDGGKTAAMPRRREKTTVVKKVADFFNNLLLHLPTNSYEIL